MPDLNQHIHAGLLGIAVGDALGLPADVHRTARSPWVRSRLWDASRELSEERVARPLLPFVLDALNTPRLVPTDDTETAALALSALAELGADAEPEALFDFWRSHAVRDDVWGGVAERAAARNATNGLRPPLTGTDHPADTSDSAAPAGIVIGIALRDDPSAAARFARQWAEITHHEDGLDAAVFTAVLAGSLAQGVAWDEAIPRASESVTSTWLANALDAVSARELTSPADLLAALPQLLAEFSPRNYSAGGIAAQTVPLAMLVLRATHAQPELAVPLAMMFPRHSDSLPAIVGGLTAAAHGSGVYEAVYGEQLGTLAGVFYPTLDGVDLRELADRAASALATSQAGSAE